jgi:predicted HAD superfamily Cof-like phosphohydrolase
MAFDAMAVLRDEIATLAERSSDYQNPRPLTFQERQRYESYLKTFSFLDRKRKECAATETDDCFLEMHIEVDQESRAQLQVKEFHDAMNIRVANIPSIPDSHDIRYHLMLVVEECVELVQACGLPKTAAKHLLELIRSLVNMNCLSHQTSIIDVVDALADIKYVVHSMFLAFGVKDVPIFDEVHRANMAKVGGPIRESDGKRLKPEGWKPPDILSKLEEQGLDITF